jgi:hypothetical protein
MFLTPLAASPDPFLRESLYKLCVDPPHTLPCGPQVVDPLSDALAAARERAQVSVGQRGVTRMAEPLANSVELAHYSCPPTVKMRVSAPDMKRTRGLCHSLSVCTR